MKLLYSTKNNILFNKYLPILFILLAIFPFFYLSIYNNPSADDFEFAEKVKNKGFINAQIFWYTSWTGRYFSTFLISLGAKVAYPLIFYKLFPISFFLMLLILFYLIVKELFIKICSKGDLFLFSCCLLFLYLSFMPSIAQGFYWASGAITYQGANILILLTIFLLIRFYKISYLFKKYFLYFICISLIFFSAGMNETSLLLMFILIFIFQFYYILKYKKPAIFALGLLLFLILFSFIVFLAPGNTIRMANFSNNHNFWQSILMSLKQGFIFIFYWLIKTPILPITVLFIPLASKFYSVIIDKKYYFNNFHPIIAFSILYLSVSLLFFPGYWSMNKICPDRTINVIYLFFIFGWFSAVTITIGYIGYKYKYFFSTLYPALKIIMLAVIIFYLICDFSFNNTISAYKDIFTGRAKKYDLEMKKRYEVLKYCNTCDLEPLKNKPNTLFNEDILPNESFWINIAMSKYLKKQYIRTK